MTMLNELQRAINSLESDKNDLLKKIEKECWKDDRHENKIIPEKTTLDDLMTIGVIPEKKLLSPNVGRLYQLKNFLRKHTPPIKYKEKDTLAALNALCKETIYDLVTWRKVEHFCDIRNLCDHDKEREPTKDEVAELINGVSAMLKTHNQ